MCALGRDLLIGACLGRGLEYGQMKDASNQAIEGVI